MSYTNIELIRHHLEAPYPVRTRVVDQPIVVDGDSEIAFFGGAIDAGNIKVKTIRKNELNRAALMVSSSRLPITSSPLVNGSVVVASDSSMGTLYVENEDYAVGYTTGELVIKESGRISVGQTIVVWYLAYHLYVAGVDYVIDTSLGTIRRYPSGEIALGETVYVDYSPIYQSYRDEILNNAVLEANNMIEKAVDPDGQFGADIVLQTAATYRALEIVCRAAVGRELSSQKGNDRTATAWMKLGDYYAERSDSLLNSFRPPLTNPSNPVLS